MQWGLIRSSNASLGTKHFGLPFALVVLNGHTLRLSKLLTSAGSGSSNLGRSQRIARGDRDPPIPMSFA